MKDIKEKIIEDFDKKFPPFEGVGATFPMFEDTPNREHIKTFLISSLSLQKQEIVKDIERLEIARPNSEREKGIYEIKCAWLSEVKDQLRRTLTP